MTDFFLTQAAVNAAIWSGKDWTTFGICRTEDPELFFPSGHEGGWKEVIADAKSVCLRCPVAEHCLQYALDNNIEYGVWGGLSEKERRALKRRQARTVAQQEAIDDMRQPDTLFDAWKARTRPLTGGHLGWSGTNKIYFSGVSYTPNQAAFIATRERKPYGQVLSTCGVPSCLLPEHLADAKERHEREVRADAR